MYPSIMSGSSVASTVEICGKTGGQSFSNVQRPDTIGQCPTGTSPCNPDAAAINMVCYPDDTHDTNCPITEILFVETAQLGNYDNYTSAVFNDTVTLIWKKDSDALPATGFKLETS